MDWAALLLVADYYAVRHLPELCAAKLRNRAGLPELEEAQAALAPFADRAGFRGASDHIARKLLALHRGDER